MDALFEKTSVDEIGVNEMGVDKLEVDELGINHFHWLLSTLRIVCYL